MINLCYACRQPKTQLFPSCWGYILQRVTVSESFTFTTVISSLHSSSKIWICLTGAILICMEMVKRRMKCDDDWNQQEKCWEWEQGWWTWWWIWEEYVFGFNIIHSHLYFFCSLNEFVAVFATRVVPYLFWFTVKKLKILLYSIGFERMEEATCYSCWYCWWWWCCCCYCPCCCCCCSQTNQHLSASIQFASKTFVDIIWLQLHILFFHFIIEYICPLINGKVSTTL